MINFKDNFGRMIAAILTSKIIALEYFKAQLF